MGRHPYSNFQSGAGISAPKITWAVQRLILLNAAVFALQLAVAPLSVYLEWFGPYWLTGQHKPIESFLAFQPGLFLSGMIWKPFTYQFLHGGLMHLFMNMLWLFFFGPDVERRLGTRQFFRFYIFCGALGVLVNLAPYLLGGSSSSIVGASGAVMGVMVAFAIIDPDRQFFLFPLPFPITARGLVIIVIVLNLVMGLSPNDGVSVPTHFGGMGAGFAVMWFLPRYHAWQRRRRQGAAKGTVDKMGEAVDNIFKFEGRKRH